MRKTKEVLRLGSSWGWGSARSHAVAGWGWARFTSIWNGRWQPGSVGRCPKA